MKKEEAIQIKNRRELFVDTYLIDTLFKGKAVRFKFELTDADLYALQIADGND